MRRLRLELCCLSMSVGCAALTPPPPAPTADTTLTKALSVVVYDIEDAADVLDAPELSPLSQLFRARIGEQDRFIVIPSKKVRGALQGEKREGYAVDYDEATQIEIGKAVSASYIMRPQLITIGTRCTVSAVLYDLKTESEAESRSIEIGCGLDAQQTGWTRLAIAYGLPAGTVDAGGQWDVVSETITGSSGYKLTITQRGSTLAGTGRDVRWEGQLTGKVFKGNWKAGISSGRLEVTFSGSGTFTGRYGLGQAEMSYGLKGTRIAM